MTGQLAIGLLVVAAVPTVAIAGRRFEAHWWHALCAGTGLVALSLVLLPLVGSVLQPAFDRSAGKLPLLAAQFLVASWWALVARALAQALKSVLRLDRNFHVDRLVSDMGEAAIVLATLIVILDVAFGVSVPGLVATSGIIAIVLGLALQNTLGDLFSGIAIGIDRPFRALDTISVDDGVEGTVIDLDWRSTRIETASGDVATIPNSVLAKARIVNRDRPCALRKVAVPVRLGPGLPPQDGVELLREAAIAVAAMAENEPPDVVCIALASDGHGYEVTVTCPTARIAELRSELLHQIARHARYAGIAIAPSPAAAASPPPCSTLIAEDATLGPLSAERRAEIAAIALRRCGPAGTILVADGMARPPLALISRGVLQVRCGAITTKLGPGDSFGAALSGGEVSDGMVVALTQFVVHEIAWDVVVPLLPKGLPPERRATARP